MFSRPIHWRNSLFLIGTLVTTLSAVPAYIWYRGMDAFQLGLFLFFFAATGLSITLGYHRLYSHQSFKATWPVRFFTLLFGAAAFENSALCWAADHRRHHKHSDGDDDPYDISKGFFHAHMGWILFRCPPETSLDWVRDLQQDRLVMWQHRYYVPIALATAFAAPTALGWVYGGWWSALGAFLIGGVARVVFVHHMTFFINSLCHTIGRQPYSSRCSARDSAIMAWFTFGEGYHNFHHEFQHDYRNGVKPWQFDPTKWCIWLLHKAALVRNLRRVSEDKILLAQAAEQHRQIAARLSDQPSPAQESLQRVLHAAQARLQQASKDWQRRKTAYREAADLRVKASRGRLEELRREAHEAAAQLRAAWREWQNARRLVQDF
ncbi:MAG: fatty acid desaturase [Verrucomicrobiota bacterium]